MMEAKDAPVSGDGVYFALLRGWQPEASFAEVAEAVESAGICGSTASLSFESPHHAKGVEGLVSAPEAHIWMPGKAAAEAACELLRKVVLRGEPLHAVVAVGAPTPSLHLAPAGGRGRGVDGTITELELRRFLTSRFEVAKCFFRRLGKNPRPVPWMNGGSGSGGVGGGSGGSRNLLGKERDYRGLLCKRSSSADRRGSRTVFDERNFNLVDEDDRIEEGGRRRADDRDRNNISPRFSRSDSRGRNDGTEYSRRSSFNHGQERNTEDVYGNGGGGGGGRDGQDKRTDFAFAFVTFANELRARRALECLLGQKGDSSSSKATGDGAKSAEGAAEAAAAAATTAMPLRTLQGVVQIHGCSIKVSYGGSGCRNDLQALRLRIFHPFLKRKSRSSSSSSSIDNDRRWPESARRDLVTSPAAAVLRRTDEGRHAARRAAILTRGDSIAVESAATVSARNTEEEVDYGADTFDVEASGVDGDQDVACSNSASRKSSAATVTTAEGAGCGGLAVGDEALTAVTAVTLANPDSHRDIAARERGSKSASGPVSPSPPPQSGGNQEKQQQQELSPCRTGNAAAPLCLLASSRTASWSRRCSPPPPALAAVPATSTSPAAATSQLALPQVSVEEALQGWYTLIRVLDADNDELLEAAAVACDRIGGVRLLGRCRRRCVADFLFQHPRDAMAAVIDIELLRLVSSTGKPVKILLKPESFNGGAYDIENHEDDIDDGGGNDEEAASSRAVTGYAETSGSNHGVIANRTDDDDGSPAGSGNGDGNGGGGARGGVDSWPVRRKRQLERPRRDCDATSYRREAAEGWQQPQQQGRHGELQAKRSGSRETVPLRINDSEFHEGSGRNDDDFRHQDHRRRRTERGATRSYDCSCSPGCDHRRSCNAARDSFQRSVRHDGSSRRRPDRRKAG